MPDDMKEERVEFNIAMDTAMPGRETDDKNDNASVDMTEVASTRSRP